MNIASVLALLVVFVACPLNWLVAYLLWRLARSAPELSTLRERAIAATVVAIAVSVFALIMLNNDFAAGLFNTETAKLISRFATLALSLAPALWWLRLYRKGES